MTQNKRIHGFCFLFVLLLTIFCFNSVCMAESAAEADDSGTELDLEGLFADGGFCYQGLSWGMTSQQVMDQTGITLTQLDKSIPNYYLSDEMVSIGGQTAERVQYGFQPDRTVENQEWGPDSYLDFGLDIISFDFKAEDGGDLTEVLDAAVAKMEKAFGEAERMEFPKAYSIGYRWFSENEDGQKSSLQIHAGCQGKRITEFQLYVGVITEQDNTETETEA